VALSDGTQRCVFGSEASAADPSAVYQAIRTIYAGGQVDPTSGNFSYGLTIDSFNSDGFSITASASAGSDDVAWLALKFGGRQVTLLDYTSPTTTGNHAITGVGFEPQFALLFLTNLEAVDPSFPITASDLMAGLSICAIGDEQWANAVRVNNGEATTDTASQSLNVAVLGPSATACDAIKATLTSFDSDGLTLNYSAVQGTAKKGFMLCIQ
jgi:hypothetical protein